MFDTFQVIRDRRFHTWPYTLLAMDPHFDNFCDIHDQQVYKYIKKKTASNCFNFFLSCMLQPQALSRNKTQVIIITALNSQKDIIGTSKKLLEIKKNDHLQKCKSDHRLNA